MRRDRLVDGPLLRYSYLISGMMSVRALLRVRERVQ
jgi:hypothetical protein